MDSSFGRKVGGGADRVNPAARSSPAGDIEAAIDQQALAGDETRFVGRKQTAASAISPAYLARNQAPLTPRDLLDHACINYRWSGTGVLYRWRFDGPDGMIEMAVEGPLTLNDSGLLLRAAVEGVGLTQLPEAYVAADMASGRLVGVLRDWQPSFSGFFLYYPGRALMPPPLRAFVDFLVQKRA